jgi:hypothetical protein
METKNDILNQLKPKKVELPTDDFFENLTQNALKSKKIKHSNIRIVYYSVISIAALLVIGVFVFNPETQQKKQASVQLAEVETHELENYINLKTPGDTLKKVEGQQNILKSIPTEELKNYFKELEIETLSEEENAELFNL